MTVDSQSSEVGGLTAAPEHTRLQHRNVAGSDATKRSRVPIAMLILVLASAAVLYVVMIRPTAFGFYHDEAIYASTAKALAGGQGYRIINLPGEPAETKYPPFYPFMLSLIWRAYPGFPDNIVPMILLSMAFTIGFFALTYFYLTGRGYAGAPEALLVVGLAAINWRTVIPATSVCSEMLFAMLSVAALYQAEQAPEPNKIKRASAGVMLGTLIGLAILTRSSGVALLISIALYYAIVRQWRRALAPLVIGGLVLAGWLGWCYMNRTPVEGVNVAYYTSYLGHFKETVEDLSAVNHTSAVVTVLGIVGRNAFMLAIASIPVVCLGIGYEALVYLGFTFLFFAAGFWRHWSRGVRLLHVYVVCYLVLHFFWLPFVSYDRFLIPLLPFLLLFLIVEFEASAALVRRELSSGDTLKRVSAAFIGLALVLLAGIMAHNYSFDVYNSVRIGSFRKPSGPPADDREAIEWIKDNTDVSDVLLCYRDPMYFLYTGRKATRFFPMKAGITWRPNQHLVFDIVTQSRARYLIITASDFETDYEPELERQSFRSLIDQHTEIFTPAFEAENGRSIIYRVANKAESSASTGAQTESVATLPQQHAKENRTEQAVSETRRQ